MTGLTEHHLRARRAPFCRVTRQILWTDVRFGFGDTTNRVALRMFADQIFAQQLLRHADGFLFVECAGKLQGSANES